MKRLFLLILLAFALVLPPAGAETGAFRAICMGVTHYADGRVRTGGENSTRGVADVFTHCCGIESCPVLLDQSAEDMLSAIADAFSDAGDADVSVVYINAHGASQAGIPYIETCDGGRITPSALKDAFAGVRGRVLLLIDCCMSGGFIGSAGYADTFSNGFIRAFSDNVRPGVNLFSSTKFLVCASCSFDQDSYRIAAGSADEINMSTVFSRALCEALGWDLIKDRPTAFKADTDADGSVTFAELCLYTRSRCMYYLGFSSPALQSIQYCPQADALVLAVRARHKREAS